MNEDHDTAVNRTEYKKGETDRITADTLAIVLSNLSTRKTKDIERLLDVIFRG